MLLLWHGRDTHLAAVLVDSLIRGGWAHSHHGDALRHNQCLAPIPGVTVIPGVAYQAEQNDARYQYANDQGPRDALLRYLEEGSLCLHTGGVEERRTDLKVVVGHLHEANLHLSLIEDQ